MFDPVSLLDSMGSTVATVIGSLGGIVTGYSISVAYGFVKSLGMKKLKDTTNAIIQEKVMAGKYGNNLLDMFELKAKNRPYRKIAKRIAKWM